MKLENGTALDVRTLLKEQGVRLEHMESILENGFDKVAEELRLTRLDNSETRQAMVDYLTNKEHIPISVIQMFIKLLRPLIMGLAFAMVAVILSVIGAKMFIPAVFQ